MVKDSEDDSFKKSPYGWVGAVVIVAILFFSIGYVVHTPAAKTTTTVTLYEALAPQEVAYFENTIIPAYEQSHPNVIIELANLASPNDVASEVTALEKSGNVGNTMVGLDNLVVGNLIYSSSGNLLMNLTNTSSTMLPNTLIPSAVNMTNYEKNVFGGIYFMPFRSNLPLTFYNKTAFSKAGISAPPTNDSQLLADAKLLNSTFGGNPQVMFQGAGLTGTHSGASTGTELYQWMVQYGGNPFVFNDTGDVHAWQFLYNLSKYFNPQYKGGYWGSYSGLANGQYSLLDYQWPYIYNTLENSTYKMTNKTLGVYGGPAGAVNDNHLLGGDVLAIPKGATNVPYLEQFANYLLSSQVQKETLVNLSWVAVNSQAYQNLPSSYSAVGAALQKAISGGIFLRNPTPWITNWNTMASQAWADIIVNHNVTYSQIPATLNSYNSHMYTYLKQNYGASVANQYEAGGYQPISV